MTQEENMKENPLYERLKMFMVRVECDGISPLKTTEVTDKRYITEMFIGADISEVLEDAKRYFHEHKNMYPNYKILSIQMSDVKPIHLLQENLS